MKNLRRALAMAAAAIALVLVASPASVRAQDRVPDGGRVATRVPDERRVVSDGGRVFRTGLQQGTIPAWRVVRAVEGDLQRDFEMGFRIRRPIVRIGQDYVVHKDDRVRQVVVVSGIVTIDGQVDEDVIVTLGDVHLSSTAVVGGSVVVVAGNVTVTDGASVRQDLVVVGGSIDAPPGFSSRGEHVIIGTPPLGEWLRGVVPWFTRGLLWGRVVVPGLGWVWGVVAVFFFVSLMINLVFDRPVRAAAELVTERPLSAFLVGLMVLILLGPALLILAATVIGLLVIPFVVCAVIVAWMIGKVGIARGIGASVMPQSDRESRPQALRSFAIGFAAIVIAYMVPVLGLIAWAMVGVFGLGAATITFVSALRRESPKRPDAPPVAPPPSPGSPPPPAPGFVPPPAPVYEPGPAMSFAEAPEPAPSPPASPAHPATGYATFLDRIAAFVLDCLLVAIADNVLHFTRADGPFFLLLFIYHVAFWVWMGTTMGGIVVGIKVVRTAGGNVRFVDALVRALSSLFSMAALGIGCLWMLQDPDRQMWHDKIAGTYVVKVPRNLLLA